MSEGLPWERAWCPGVLRSSAGQEFAPLLGERRADASPEFDVEGLEDFRGMALLYCVFAGQGLACMRDHDFTCDQQVVISQRSGR